MSHAAVAIDACALAVALVGHSRAEDTAAVLAAMPDQAAEQRYLDELCRRTEIALSARVAAIDRAAAVYRAKRDAAPTVCRASADGTVVVDAKLLEKTNAQTLGAQRAECEKACRELAAGDACVANCARYK